MSVDYGERYDIYLNQSLSHDVATGKDEYNKFEYGGSTVTIKGRKIGETRRITNEQGEVITTDTYVLTRAVVKVGDMIDGKVGKYICEARDLPGDLKATECFI